MARKARKKPEELMKSFTVRMSEDLMERLKERAGLIPVSIVIRKLIEMYVNGEIELRK